MEDEILHAIRSKLEALNKFKEEAKFNRKYVFETMLEEFLKLQGKETQSVALRIMLESLQKAPTLFESLVERYPDETLPILIELDNVPMQAWGDVVYFNPSSFEQFHEKQKSDFDFLARLVMYNPLVYQYYPEHTKARREVQLAFLKACIDFDIYINEYKELFEPIIPSLRDRAFIREAVARYPLITYLAPKDFLEEPEFAYALFNIHHEAVKPLYFPLEDCSDLIDQARVGAELKAKIEAERFNEQTPEGSATPKPKFKL